MCRFVQRVKSKGGRSHDCQNEVLERASEVASHRRTHAITHAESRLLALENTRDRKSRLIVSSPPAGVAVAQTAVEAGGRATVSNRARSDRRHLHMHVSLLPPQIPKYQV